MNTESAAEPALLSGVVRTVKLKELCDRITKGSTPTSYGFAYASSGIRFIKAENIDASGSATTTSDFIDEQTHEFLKRSRLQSDDILFSIAGTIGRVGLVRAADLPANTNQALAIVRLRPGVVHPRFLLHYLRAPQVRNWVTHRIVGVGRANLSLTELGDIDVPLLPLRAQEEVIAEIEKQFSRLDEAVTNLERAKANLKRYRAAVLQSAVDGRLLGDVAVGAEPTKNWVWGTCDDVIESIQAGASFKCVERPPGDGEVGVVKVSAVTWGEFDERESKTCLDPERVKESLFIRSGDFLFSRANTIELVGACVIATRVTKSLMLSDKILRFRLAAGLVPQWLLVCLQSKSGRTEIERLATGNQESMRNIGQDRIRQIRLPLPPTTEQHRIVAEVERRLSVIREVGVEVDANLNRAQALRQAALAAVFK